MRASKANVIRSVAVFAALTLAVAACGSSTHHGLVSPQTSASPSLASEVRFETLPGFAAPGTPARLNMVGVIETGPSSAKNVLVLVPGTSAAAAYFEPLAKDIVTRAPGWQVWAVERRENLLEDQSMLDKAKQAHATAQQLFDYYLGYLSKPSVTPHFQLIADSSVAFARQWGMKVAVEDLHAVVGAAKKLGGKVVLGGHSLGGSITTAYATWDFKGQVGASDLSGLVYDDGGSNPAPVSAQMATSSLRALQKGSPWLAFGGIGAPYAGVFNSVASTLVKIDPNGGSPFETFRPLPSNLRPPVPATNEGGYGFALDTKTSPPSLRAAQAHLGHLAASGAPRGWDDAGELTPLQRYADMFSGTGLTSLVGTAWYHPQRLTIDSGAVAEGNANPAQAILDVDATHGHDLPKGLRIYAFGAALGGQGVVAAAQTLAQQSGIPPSQLTLLNHHDTYAHNDPAGASPTNAFLDGLVPFLANLGG
jgi:pimeloyl-ACP methyl ester carboxylesterase